LMAVHDKQAWTAVHDVRLRSYLARDGYRIPSGLGSEEAACSVAAIRLAWDGRLSDDPPPCMSTVIAGWISGVQQAMPAAIRDSAEWKHALPRAAGTGREITAECERFGRIMEWMWDTVLPIVQRVADTNGFGEVWYAMCNQRSDIAAYAARDAAREAGALRAVGTKAVMAAAFSAAQAAVEAAGVAKWYADYSADDATWLHDGPGAGAWFMARSAEYTARAVPRSWGRIDPVGLLNKLCGIEPQGLQRGASLG